MAPAFVVVALGVNATQALIVSQVVLSFALPVPMVALVHFTRRRDIMGEFANGPLTDVAAIAASFLILALNGILLFQTFGITLPGFSG
jgi:manganese transport protein